MSPTLDVLLDSGRAFHGAISPYGNTPVWHVSLFSGLHPVHHGICPGAGQRTFPRWWAASPTPATSRRPSPRAPTWPFVEVSGRFPEVAARHRGWLDAYRAGARRGEAAAESPGRTLDERRRARLAALGYGD